MSMIRSVAVECAKLRNQIDLDHAASLPTKLSHLSGSKLAPSQGHNGFAERGVPIWQLHATFSACPRLPSYPGHPGAAAVPGAMGPLLLVLLYPLPCVSGLPFYNGFYYSNNPNGWNLGNGHGEGIFNGVKLVVETPEETLFSHRGANATLPCRYHYEPALLSPRPVRVKWWKLSENGAPEQDVLVAIGPRHRSFGDYRGRVRLRRDGERQVSLQIRGLRLEDSGRYRCEVIDGLEDESGLVELELRGEAPRGGGMWGPGPRGERAPRNFLELCAFDSHAVLKTTPRGNYCSHRPILQMWKQRHRKVK
uniref:Ig-like domain-containing protein n=2 Tax=Ursus maritimus TaxID=29073 RepID=A0A452TJ91_URSMA